MYKRHEQRFVKQNSQQGDESGNDSGHAETGRNALLNAFGISCSVVLSGICQKCSGKCDCSHLHHAIILIGGGISGNKGRTPVSYTHLDVYKRQPRMRLMQPMRSIRSKRMRKEKMCIRDRECTWKMKSERV